MKKTIIILSVIFVILLITSCSNDSGNDLPAATNEIEASAANDSEESQKNATAENIATQEPVATEAPTIKEVDEIPEYVPETDRYYDVWKDSQYYVVPGVKTEIALEGDIGTWKIAKNSILSYSVENGKLFVTAKETGYVNLASDSGLRATIYSNKTPEKTDRRKADSEYKYYLYYEKGTHTLTIYTADDSGYYTLPFRTICTASGATMDKTPTGLFTLGTKERWHVFSAKCLAQYGINYAKGVYLHSPCYEYQRESSILSHYYNTIGESSTGGCLRMQTGYIAWIYENCESGTKLEITNGNPLGTDSGVPADISESACFDPTDPVIKDRV